MGTFSMVARCRYTGALGVCVSTAIPAVGSVVPHVEKGVAAIATQGLTNITYGIKGLKLIKKGLSPEEALKTILSDDPKRETRQVIMIDVHGRKAAYTGEETFEWKGQILGEDFIAAGNLLVSRRVLEAMVDAFNNCEGRLSEKLLSALEAGERAGGDRRGGISAALIVVGEEGLPETRPIIDLRVDLHKEPVKELRRIYNAYMNWIEMLH
ncbi:DUF1028 domain-containing protein [Candidatus Bathyarchaeota archaeon]|nr:MAG: DUF1028 domain-containing protein [Candidatus Bathyarchaeota archaeon]